MAGIYGYSREAVRVKVKKCESNIPPEWRKFSVDPQITSVEVLYSILAKAFDIRSDFSISYRAIDPTGHEQFLAVLSDWDLDAAFLRTHNNSVQTGSEPCLNLLVDVKSFSEANDWEVNSPLTAQKNEISQPVQSQQQNQNHHAQQQQQQQQQQQSFGIKGQKYVQNMQTKLPGLIMNHVEKTFSMVQRALNFAEDQIPIYPPRPPLSDSEFRGFLDSVGQILKTNDLRKVIFLGGIDPSLRRVVWKHILNVYPKGMTGRQRMDYMKSKATEYYRLRDVWKLAVQQGPVNGDDLAYVTSMVRKDVLRTDRLHPFYAGSDDNKNIASLFNILTTYALNHPSVSYCQGMSDIASPLLVTMSDEAHAYICFCAIMSRLQANFMLDGIAMTQKFNHLAEAIQFYDPEFFEYLKSQQADDLLFCYRWLLLELKREFPFEDSMRMLEVQWSSLRYEPPAKELSLFEKEFIPTPIDIQQNLESNNLLQPQKTLPMFKSPSAVMMCKQRENHYTKVCALRRQSSSLSLLSHSPITNTGLLTFGTTAKLDATKRLNQSLDENISSGNQHLKLRKNMVKSHQSLDEQKMLMLMKSISVFESTKSDDDEDDYGDNFDIEKVSLVEENYESLKETNDNTNELKANIIFHPTNPFLSDTLKVENDDESVLKKDVKNHHNQHSGFNHVSHKTIMKVPNNNNHNNTIFTNTSNILSKQLNNKKGGHFKDLKDKIAASKKGILASLDKMESQFELTNSKNILNRSASSAQQHQTSTVKNDVISNNIPQKNKEGQKIKNFNEFLNLTTMNKNGISDKLIENSKIHSREETLNSSKKFDETEMYDKQKEQPFKPLHFNSKINQSQFSLDGSSPDDSQDYYPMTTSITRELRLEMENLDRQVFGQAQVNERCNTEIKYEKLGKNSIDLIDVKEEEILSCPDSVIVMRKSFTEHKLQIGQQVCGSNNDQMKRISTCSNNTDIFVWENPLHQISGTSSCNFNDIILVDNEDVQQLEQQLQEEELNKTIQPDIIYNEFLLYDQNQKTPDEQQDLEYDGDIIIECTSEDSDKIHKTCTPLRLVQQKNLITNGNLTANNDSDSDNQELISKNPFLHHEKDTIDLDFDGNGCLNSDGKILVNVKTEGVAELSQPTPVTPPSMFNKNINLLNDPISIINPQFGEEAGEDEYESRNEEIDANVISFSQKQNYFLPSPKELGDGNPFLIFLCLTLLLQHRNTIIKNSMDYNEMAMHFDKMVRKHNVTRVLNQARRMYFEYLKAQNSITILSGKNDNTINTEPTKS